MIMKKFTSPSNRISMREEVEDEASDRFIKGNEKPKYQLLHEYFLMTENPDKVAVIYEEGRGQIRQLTYSEVDNLANIIEKKLRTKITKGFIGVSCQLNELFPCIQLGLMRSGCGTFFIANNQWNETVDKARELIYLNFLLLDDQVFYLKGDWIKHQICVHDYIELISNGKSEIFHLIELNKKSEYENEEVKITVEPFKFAYAMMTSGTTGNQKIVLVPHMSIVPNIDDFIRRVWQLTSNDVIFGGSPPTFDPSMVELFCALGCGGSVLYVPNEIKYDGVRLGNIFMKHCVSILQITPSLFRKISDELKAAGYFTAETSCLKVLAFGGEPCLTKENLRYYLSREMFDRLRTLVNLYGLTEMSCWASFGKINPYDTDPICIGQALMETSIDISQHLDPNDIVSPGAEQILIESETRICTVLDWMGNVIQSIDVVNEGCLLPKKSNTYRKHSIKTGDYGILHEKLNLGIEYLWRIDSVAKISGMKVPLSEIEKMAMETNMLKTAHCISHNDKIYLMVVPKENSTSTLGLGKYVRAEFLPRLNLDITPEFYPSCIIALHSIPINENGKIDMKGILKLAETQQYRWMGQYIIPKDSIMKIIYPLWIFITGNRKTPLPQVLRENFYQMGGNSSNAVWLIENIFMLLTLYGSPFHKELEVYLYRRLFVSTYHSICDYIASELSKQPLTAKIALISAEQVSCSSAANLEIEMVPDAMPCQTSDTKYAISTICANDYIIKSRFQSNKDIIVPQRSLMICEYDLQMCVDANTAVSSAGQNFGLVIVGSHSGFLIAVDAFELRLLFEKRTYQISSDAAVLWTINLPGRIEADVTINKEGSFVYIGCHDKSLYKLSIVDGTVIASFKTEGTIRGKVSLSEKDNFIVMVDDLNHLYCLQAKDLKLHWKRSVTAGLRSTQQPLIASDIIMVTTINSGLLGVSIHNGSIIWPKDGMVNDCCTSPIIMPCSDGSVVVVSGSANGLDVRDCQTGEIISQYLKKGLFKTPPFTPEIHNCKFRSCKELFMVSSYGQAIRFNNCGMEINRIMLENPTVAPTVLCTRKFDLRRPFLQSEKTDGSVKCYLLSKPSNRNQFVLYSIDKFSKEKEITIEPYRASNENFSRPLNYQDMLLFGGRDNKLHIIFCHSLQ